ncbi:hypothetical protein KR059_010439, partial [Drosophila kikkawai]
RAFQKCSRLRRSPPGNAAKASAASAPSGTAEGDNSCTPLAKRNRDSPSPPGTEQPTKRHRAPQPQLVEMGVILEDLLTKVNEQKVRSINQGM